jgi:F-type H+-transporting ATPase subunit b
VSTTMTKLAVAALLLVGGRVYAQPAAPAEAERSAAEKPESLAKHEEPSDPDPTRHFNYTNVHYHGKDEYGGAYGDGEEVTPTGQKVEEEPMSPPFVFMLINFGLLLIILGKWGWPVAKKLAEDRHDQIKTQLDEAAALRDKAEQKLAEYETRIKDVDVEIKALVDGIRKDAEADKVRILAAAEAQAAQMKRDAELRIAAEIEQARAQLTQEVTAAAIAATEKIVKDKATPDDQKKLVSAFISNIGAPS